MLPHSPISREISIEHNGVGLAPLTQLYLMVRAISVYSAGVPYAARINCSGKNPATLDYVSVLEFVSIVSYLKAISSDYGSTEY